MTAAIRDAELLAGAEVRPQSIPSGFERSVQDYVRRTSGQERDFLLARDFPAGRGVRLSFPDGSFAQFQFAFFIEDPDRRLLAVFTEHCGYHVFPSGGLSVCLTDVANDS